MTAAEAATLGAVDYYRRAHPPKMKRKAFLSVRSAERDTSPRANPERGRVSAGSPAVIQMEQVT